LLNATQTAALSPPLEAPGDSAESLGAQLLSLLPALRLHSVSIFDGKGDVQWLSEGALGPDEQVVVEEAIAALTATTTRAHHEVVLPDHRGALFLAVRTPRATLAGLVMLLMDAKTLTSGNLAARILNTSVRSVLQKIAMLLVPPPPPGATGTLSGIRQFSSGTLPLEVAVVPGASLGDTANASFAKDSLEWPAAAPPPPATPGDERVLQILEPAAAAVAPAGADALAWTAPDTSGAAEITFACDPSPAVRAPEAAQPLRLRELIRLRAGGRTRRYQVVPVAEQQRGDALATLNHLLSWLHHNPQVLQGDPLSFTIGVSAQALGDPGLPAALARVLEAADLESGMIGFELREAACLSHRALVDKFLTQCERSRCFAVIDDFTFHTGVLELLRSSALRMVKVESRLVTLAMRDKLAQARVVAIAQAAKVMGTHCAAKYVDSQTGRRWLAAVGFDFTQSSVTEPMQRLVEPLSA
jgi:EAL domain-containing protein (putative c-di-GMP-specific phosphodiesterase class I)